MTFYETYLYILLGVFALSAAYKRGLSFQNSKTTANVQQQNPAAFSAFQRNFLLVYLIMMAADWMQGPYVYRLYAYYGFSRADN
eukprot:CAMPEP_0176458012 /NCGR_PEP_ID=MMETSP0127-20121128/32318_1 /TAXON_ID=938130 /ORGANISM="Platyophrya macrostoma, Strain WH" /LENGTH=83 /DNA_ID=CAMNT_0017848457 /DNA_START=49 /DNA_END=297 /DNA_ORIENTATION=+